MENEIQVYVAMRWGGTVIVLPEHMTRMIERLGAVPAEEVMVKVGESWRRSRPHSLDANGSSAMRQGMRRRPDSNAWFGECNFRRRRSWKLYRATPWAPRRARVLATSASE